MGTRRHHAVAVLKWSCSSISPRRFFQDSTSASFASSDWISFWNETELHVARSGQRPV